MNWASACFVIVVTVFACIVCTVEGRVCTRVRGEKGMKTMQYPDQCQQSYEARCGWFSTKMCTFNETIPCLKARNMTMTIYRVVEDCCPGYYRNKDGRCERLTDGQTLVTEVYNEKGLTELQDLVTETYNEKDEDKGGKPGEAEEQKPGDEDLPTVFNGSLTTVVGDDVKATSEPGGSYGHDNDEDDDNFFFGISHGAYAGIICGILFVACVALLTALHYRKRRLQQEKKTSHNAEQDVGQMQHLIHMDKIESPTSPTSPGSPTPPVTT